MASFSFSSVNGRDESLMHDGEWESKESFIYNLRQSIALEFSPKPVSMFCQVKTQVGHNKEISLFQESDELLFFSLMHTVQY